MDTGLVHCVVCLFTPQLSLVLITPTHKGMARLSWPASNACTQPATNNVQQHSFGCTASWNCPVRPKWTWICFTLPNCLGRSTTNNHTHTHRGRERESEQDLASRSTHYGSFRRWSSRQSLALVRTTKISSKINQTNTKNPKYNNILATYTWNTNLTKDAHTRNLTITIQN